MTPTRKQDALDYHSRSPAGKIKVAPSKETKSQRDLSLAYSPGVAEPCKKIHDDTGNIFKYTVKGNLVAVVSDGTAVLGLGDIGPEASKPVMEGKGVLFRIFAGIDVFDLELNKGGVDDFVDTIARLEPTFGGINLEDIKAPECFEIERKLKNKVDIPVMHDDQHGTAIITAAGLMNALELAEKDLDKIKIVISGAGASALSSARLYISMGAKKENIIMLDSKGVLKESRDDLDKFKKEFAIKEGPDTLEEALDGADMFLGLSVGGIVDGSMLTSMADAPIVFALANPTPEISYEAAQEARDDVIMATGRSDYPNQVNNVLGFPFIFRGALDVCATDINEEMKLAAAKAIADLAKEPVPEVVNLAYNKKNLSFGREYIIPKPVDPRLLTTVAPAVAKAAIESGVARISIQNWELYKEDLNKKLGRDEQLIRVVTGKAKQNPQRVVFSEAHNQKILKAAQIVRDEGIAEPILLGNEQRIKNIMEENGLELGDSPIINPRKPEQEEQREMFGRRFFEKRKRRGFNQYEAKKIMRERNYYGCMMVETGEADALISGLTRKYPDTIRPALQIIGVQEDVNRVAGMYIMLTKEGPLFFADTTVNVTPSADDLVDISLLTAEAVHQFNEEPQMALLSYSNFGSFETEESIRVRQAVKKLHESHPEIIADGEMQANLALDKQLLHENYPFCRLVENGANTFIFPNLSSGNISYKLIQSLGAAEAIGPILLGLKKPVHILQLGSSIREIVNMVTIAVIDAQSKTPVQ